MIWRHAGCFFNLSKNRSSCQQKFVDQFIPVNLFQRFDSGDEIIVDLGTHCVGYLQLHCEAQGSPQDASERSGTSLPVRQKTAVTVLVSLRE